MDFNSFLKTVDDLVWGIPLIVLILAVGFLKIIYNLYRTKLFDSLQNLKNAL